MVKATVFSAINAQRIIEILPSEILLAPLEGQPLDPQEQFEWSITDKEELINCGLKALELVIEDHPEILEEAALKLLVAGKLLVAKKL